MRCVMFRLKGILCVNWFSKLHEIQAKSPNRMSIIRKGCAGFRKNLSIILPKPFGFGKRIAREKVVVYLLTSVFLLPYLFPRIITPKT